MSRSSVCVMSGDILYRHMRAWPPLEGFGKFAGRYRAIGNSEIDRDFHFLSTNSYFQMTTYFWPYRNQCAPTLYKLVSVVNHEYQATFCSDFSRYLRDDLQSEIDSRCIEDREYRQI